MTIYLVLGISSATGTLSFVFPEKVTKHERNQNYKQWYISKNNIRLSENQWTVTQRHNINENAKLQSRHDRKIVMMLIWTSIRPRIKKATTRIHEHSRDYFH